jgi:hypothetical protein
LQHAHDCHALRLEGGVAVELGDAELDGVPDDVGVALLLIVPTWLGVAVALRV